MDPLELCDVQRVTAPLRGEQEAAAELRSADGRFRAAQVLSSGADGHTDASLRAEVS